MESSNRSKVKLLSAAIGTSALVAMAAIGLLFHHDDSASAVVAKSSTMDVGSTSTETTPSNVPAITMAVPALKGPAHLPTEEQVPAAP